MAELQQRARAYDLAIENITRARGSVGALCRESITTVHAGRLRRGLARSTIKAHQLETADATVGRG